MRASLAASLKLALYAVIIYWIWDSWRVDFLLVGDVTIDLVHGKPVAGGSITYAAAVAAGLQRSACIVTAAGPTADLSAFSQHELHVVETEQTLTFEHTYTWWGNQRKLRVPVQPGVTLTADHVPWRCLMAKTVMLGPLIPTDVDAASFTRPASLLRRALLSTQKVGLMAQGYQRGLADRGVVVSYSTPSAALRAGLTPQVTLFLSDVESDPWPAPDFQAVVASVASLVVTRGADGASVYRAGLPDSQIPAHAIEAVDTNGAGDTFAMAYMAALAGGGIAGAGRFAAWAASRVCQQPQACKPHCVVAALEGAILPSRLGQSVPLRSDLPGATVLPLHSDTLLP